jgi:aminomethyltransferase
MEEGTTLKGTPFQRYHGNMGAKMVDFAGWLMPIQYSGILSEHHAVRTGAGLFDVAHMGRLEIRGRGGVPFVQYLTTNDVSRLKPGMVQYSTICNDPGGILDDVTVYRYDEHLMIVVNASNTGKIISWIRNHMQDGVEFVDRTKEMAQLAVQGPGSQAILQRLASFDLEEIPFYHFKVGLLSGTECTVSRTGYTGEDGFEIYLPAESADEIWTAIMSTNGVTPCGLGARDLLRLEVFYCLYGNDIDETTTPLEAGLNWVVKFDKGDFIGRGSLLGQRKEGLKRRLAGFILRDKGIPRHGYPVVTNGSVVSKVASGAFSPSLRVGIGTAYLPTEIAEEGTTIEIDIRGRKALAEVVKPPFYKDGSRR